LLEITDWLTHDLSIDDFFFTAIWAAILMAIATVVVQLLLRVVLR
jgi:uncharacterized membrane protein YvlD (DUF360 family)